MSKKMKIRVRNPLLESENDSSTINTDEYPHLCVDYTPSDDEVEHALKIITTKLMKDGLNEIVIDLDEKNKELTPAKEMTISDIEKELGYKFKIVHRKSK